MDIANSADRHSRPSIEKYNVAILLFEAVEVLDFAGPFEVFSRTRLTPGVESRRSDETAPFRVFTVAKKDEAVTTTGDLKVVPHYSFRTARPIDLLVVPGGNGTRALLSDQATLDWIRVTAGTAKKVTSVCTGALSLAQAGLLDRKRATRRTGEH
jgi:putative intracellular protease/amidase